ncbi:hypothetical protein [Maribacter sp. 1_MG-2023]|uniref:hypothetical protein n=1 Tax=Maribacter sp. 1_MG-2023 TaxID=3062677 RepID=UPI0026E1475D|nr:hypothetical protein [Maribacter sp. 1_MG-2023]MDO6470926.1 hypothetical protein [Maribacter sp. 1_MG-2023]
METDLIHSEIKGLTKIRLEWSKTNMSKPKAQELVSKIGIFEHTFSVNFPIAKEYYQTDPFVKVNFLDGKEELEYYSDSDLKKKDDGYFREGKNHINLAINGLIKGLESKIKSSK